VHNIEEIVHNVERHGNDNQYSNGELAKYKKMIEDLKKSFYYGCVSVCIGETSLVEGEQRME
jgi:hypothetical protein